jgi:indole-3-glycerol phosphate synthase
VPTILDEILAHKRTEVEQARARRPLETLKLDPGYLPPRRNFYGAVSVPRPTGPNLIAEVKGASPSAGVLRPTFDPVALAQQYEQGGAQAVSVLTDERYFGGSLQDVARVKAAVGLPVLRKDFVFDPYQVVESRAAGADAILLIGDALDPAHLLKLVALARTLDLWVLLEFHARKRLLDVIQAVDGRWPAGVLFGINNRDLATQTIDLATTERLAPLAPPGIPIVAESGVRTRPDVERLHAAGARALLIGETLVRSPDPARTISELFG